MCYTLILQLTLFLGAVKGMADRSDPRISKEQVLLRDLMYTYEKSVRPVFNADKPVNIGLGLTLTQILDLDEKNQVLTTNVWLEVEWFDERLVWNSSDYGGITTLRIPCHLLWLPDIVLYNSVDDYTSGYMPSLAMVYNTSRIFWGPVVRFRSSCRIDITYFPFDDQICMLKIGSWAYNGFQVDVWNRSHTMDLANFVDNGEWELIGVKVTRNVVIYNCCDEPFPDVRFYVHLRRRVKYYFMNIIIPCIILSFLCLAGFLLPPESGEKITLGLSVLLTITVFMLMVADKMPQTSESVSVISIYLMVVLSLSCMSVLSSVFVLGIYHQRGKPKNVPRILKIITFNILSPMLCISGRGRDRRLAPSVCKRGSRWQRVATQEPEVIRISTIDQTREHMELSPHSIKDDNYVEHPVTCFDDVTPHPHTAVVKEMISMIQKKQFEETKEEEVFRDWRDVAFILDRLLFFVFLITTIISTVIILEMRPHANQDGFVKT
ncbi:neuronal acetylcholine receptor subunit alpha-10-like [Gigantopelta aegis]|uniref:neuronal acetylcholine receptor subunit alpha-10-like n=1 Tax=Gigantopelta aegis TaxID=1735272 RepID=UPI001B88AFFB|nr:neuronal acetylcholine receptor subunit alpha-10-like [Gigantopelta aegis]